MNYAEQQQRYGHYQRTFAAVLIVFQVTVALVTIRSFEQIGWVGLVFGYGLVFATLAVMNYVPLYLGLTVERRKAYVWPVKVRTVACPAVALVVTPFLSTSEQWITWAACLLIAAVGVLSARRALKRQPDADAIPLLPLALLVGDLAMLLLAATRGVVRFELCAAGLALALALFLVTAEGRARWIGLAASAVAVACFPGLVDLGIAEIPAVLLPCFAAIGTLWLVSTARKHHRSNVSVTVSELTEFAAVTPEHAEEMLATATGILARNWNSDPPVEPDAVGRWYEANSEYYLYDLAQFHLAHKHIRFMIDIVEMSNGRVLDYGAGVGDLVLELARRDHDVTYLDVDGRTKAFARWRADRDWLPVAFATDLDEVDGKFDTIISLDVFEHLAEPLPVVDRLIEKLAPGGRMIVTAYFGATKSHPMHFDHDIDLGEYLRASGLVDRKTWVMKVLRSQFLGKRGVLVFEKPD